MKPHRARIILSLHQLTVGRNDSSLRQNCHQRLFPYGLYPGTDGAS